MITLNSFFLVLCAAFFHALWNSLVKNNHKKAYIVFLISFAHFIFGIILLLFASTPSLAAWPYLIVSTVVHTFYLYFLYQSYKWGDLSFVYPLMRGVAPLIVTLGAFLFIGELPLGNGLIGIIFICAGIIILSMYSLFNSLSYKALNFALLAGFCIAAYSLLDGIGAREGNSALGYIGWLFILEGIVGMFIFWKIAKGTDYSLDRNTFIHGTIGGSLSCLAYAIIISVKVYTPLGIVSSLRETSVIFGSMIGLIIFKERPWGLRIVAALAVSVGLVFIAFS